MTALFGAEEEPRIFAPGERFCHSHHVVEAFLGAGASGQVYAVRHELTGARFALKVSHLKDRANAKKVKRALIEAQATYAIRHHNVVHIYDIGCEADGMVWQLMELLDGCSLATLLAGNARLTPLYAIDVAVEVAWGLHAAHEQQIIHRDIQPSNVFVTAAGHVKVIDFSLAKVIPSGLQTTHGQHAIGTQAYMAPEHLKGAAPTAQFDVYALGILLWQMLAGRHPFGGHLGNMMMLVKKQLEDDPESLATAAGLPAYCDDVIRRATAKDPRDRYEGAWPLARGLRDLRARLAADPEALRHFRDPPQWERRHPVQPDPSGFSRYHPSQALPRESPAPKQPTARVVVAAAASASPPSPARMAAAPLAPTVPMPVVVEPPLPRAVDPAPETVRRSAPSPSRRAWVALVAAPVLIGVCAGVWLLVTQVAQGEKAESASASPAPTARAGAGTAARRLPAAPPKR